MYKLLGLNLLYLLSVNRVSEFHTELELLQAEIIHSNKYICPILALEQYIMEGRYNKIFQAKVYYTFLKLSLKTLHHKRAVL